MISVATKWEAPPASAPAVPQNLAAVADGISITLTWDALPGRPRVRNYIIKRSLTTGDEVAVGTSTINSFVDTGLDATTEYFYTVSAVNKTGESADSSEVSEMTGTAPVQVLLQDLIADWELTADANDSTANALHLTNHGNVTFDADGAHFDGATQWLDVATSLILDSTDLMVMYEVLFPVSPANATILDYGKADDSGGFFLAGVAGDTPDPGASTLAFTHDNDGANYTGVAVSPGNTLDNNVRGIYFGWWNSATGFTSAQLNNATAASSSDPQTSPALGDVITIGTYANGAPQLLGIVRRIRIWNGASAIKSASARTWLYNAGAGRTFAELGDYTE